MKEIMPIFFKFKSVNVGVLGLGIPLDLLKPLCVVDYSFHYAKWTPCENTASRAHKQLDRFETQIWNTSEERFGLVVIVLIKGLGSVSVCKKPDAENPGWNVKTASYIAAQMRF